MMKKTTAKDLADGLEQAARAMGKGVKSDVTANLAWAIRKGDKRHVQKLLDKHIDDIIGEKSTVNQIMQWLNGDDSGMDQREKQERQATSVRYPRNPFVYKSRFTPIVYTVGFKTMTKKTNEPLWWTGRGFKDLGMVRTNPEEFATESEAEAKIKTDILEFIRRWREDDSHLIIGWDEQATEDMTMRSLIRRLEEATDPLSNSAWKAAHAELQDMFSDKEAERVIGIYKRYSKDKTAFAKAAVNVRIGTRGHGLVGERDWLDIWASLDKIV
jgi:hypothetical protein